MSPPDSMKTSSSCGNARCRRFDRLEVDRGVLADGRVRAAAGLDAEDALRRQGIVAHQELGVLAGVDVVGHRRDLVALAQAPAQQQRQRGLAGTDRPADTDAQGTVAGRGSLRRGGLGRRDASARGGVQVRIARHVMAPGVRDATRRRRTGGVVRAGCGCWNAPSGCRLRIGTAANIGFRAPSTRSPAPAPRSTIARATAAPPLAPPPRCAARAGAAPAAPGSGPAGSS